jgi:hypothetical protein
MQFRFSVRDLLWLTLVVAMATGSAGIMGFQIQIKPTPEADWSQFGPVLPDRNQALERSRQIEEILPHLKKVEPLGMKIAAIRVVDEDGKQIWESPAGD